VEPRLGLRGIRKAYVAPVLAGIDLDLVAGEVHALVGENGAGKSTLARIMAGLTAPDGGTMTLDGAGYVPAGKRAAADAGVRLCLQELSVTDTLTVAESIFLEALPRRFGLLLDRVRLNAQAQPLMAAVGLGALDPALPMAALGVGQRQLVEIAAALARPCRLLILDEPTAALTRTETDLLFAEIRRLRAAGTTVVYISHRLEEIGEIADRVTILRDGVLMATLPAATTPADALIHLMVGRAVDERRPSARRPPQQEVALRVVGLRAGAAVRDVSFEVRRGEILGLSGLMGAGRTETLRAIFGADRRDAGEIFVSDDGTSGVTAVPMRGPAEAVRRGLAFVTEDRKAEGLLPPLPLAANLTLARLGAVADRFGFLRRADERNTADVWRKRLAIRSAGAGQPAGELSGGNQQKVIIARWLFRGSEIFLFDEPTRGIDVGARNEIYRLLWELADDGKAVVVASSDLRELLLLCDRIVVLSRGLVSGSFERPAFCQAALTAAAFAEHRSPRAAATAAGASV